MEGKTIRPGFGRYDFYHSDRHPVPVTKTVATPVSTGHHARRLLTLIICLATIAGAWAILHSGNSFTSGSSGGTGRDQASIASIATAAKMCKDNSLSQLVVVSVSKRHLWACEASKSVYESPVITGMENLVADRTPRGTYHVYGMETDLTLTGSDSTGKWSDPVSYWMPFLYNDYGAYGFHDATWRPDSAFGKIDPNSSDASHGCVELPLGSAKWLYDWTKVGTTVTIEN